MTVRQLVPEHPVRACARVISSALDQVTDVDPIYMTTPDKAASLVELNRLSARLESPTAAGARHRRRRRARLR